MIDDDSSNATDPSVQENNEVEEEVSLEDKWGFPLEDLYRLSLKFYRGKLTLTH